jgi:TetR/AcrR family transcriptional regulator, mexJK operon transcriptional repressor
MAPTTMSTTTSLAPRTSPSKHQAILDAAETIFLRDGYLGTSMDEVAARSHVSKQTVYKHFGSKESLFVEIVTSMTSRSGDAVEVNMSAEAAGDDVRTYLRDYALTQLTVVVTPRLMQLRRLVIGEVARFPELARVLHESGPKRAISQLAATFEQLAERRLLTLDDSALAASHFNWLVMAEPLNRAMLLGDDSIPSEQELRRHAEQSVQVFLAAYGAH